jgi:hypothetical protein
MENRLALLVLVVLSGTACSDGGSPSKPRQPGLSGPVGAGGGGAGGVGGGGAGGALGGGGSQGMLDGSTSPPPDAWAPPPDAFATPPDGSGPPDPGCGLNTGYPGDDQCILPPPPHLGFQIHVGPVDYANPGSDYLLQPGDEKTTRFSRMAANTENTYFYYRQYRMRPTAHHVILDTPNGSGVDTGRRIGTANTSQDFPAGGMIAPEDQGVGMPIAANSPVSVDLHAINTTQAPALREVWVNFWYKNPGEVTEPAIPWFKTGSVSFAIQPRQSTTLGPYNCTVDRDGRLLWLYGHRHANNVRFNVVRVRGAQRDVIYDAYHWEEPLLLEYNSLVQNPAPDAARKVEGGWSGVLDLKAGDRIEWYCDVVNTQNSVLRFTNQTYLGEMCIVDAEAVGSSCVSASGGF